MPRKISKTKKTAVSVGSRKKTSVKKNASTKAATSYSTATKVNSRNVGTSAISKSPKSEKIIGAVAPLVFRKRTKINISKLKDDVTVSKPLNVPQEQWDLPVTIKSDGEFGKLSEIATNTAVSKTLASLSGQDKKRLVLKRIEDAPSYPTRMMLGIGEVDRNKAIEEVKKGSPAGQFILESEQRLIQLMLDRLQNKDV